MARIIGIDLGTTNSLAAVFHQDGPMLIPNALGVFLTPSIAGIDARNRVVTGGTAREMSLTKPERCVARFKRWMGEDRAVDLEGQSFSAPELASLVLKSIVADAAAHLGEAVTDAVITVPAYFNHSQRKATVLAGELAGLKVRRIINEPTAAALTYGYHQRGADKKVLVFDLGGGTFDVTLMEIFEDTLEIIATAGESQLGGEDFTETIHHWVVEAQELEPTAIQAARLRKECEAAKLVLSENPVATIRIPDKQGHFGDDPRTQALDHETFAKLNEPLIARLRGPLERALRDAELGVDDVEDVILVGGAARMPVVVDLLEELFGKTPLQTHNPDEVVAMGAAVQAALLDDHQAVEDMVLTDVCPFTLGVEISKRLGRTVRDGYYLPIIHRNTTTPVSREETLATLYPNQSKITLHIFQGESRRTKDNHLLGVMEVQGIPPGPEGQPVVVRFTYDMNGILEVEATIPETGFKTATVLTHHVKGLNEAQIQEAVSRMQELKFTPRDDVRNQHLLYYCEQVMGELPLSQREQMEDALDQFEATLYGDDTDQCETAREALIEMLSAFGLDFEEPPEERDRG